MKKILTLLLCLSTQNLHALNLEQKIDSYLDQAQLNPSIKTHWTILKKNNYVENTGPDETYRTQYVDLQGIIESVLADEKDVKVTAIIHTALPPTPLRTEGAITPGLVSAEVAANPALIATVTKRCNILRRFLNNKKRLYAIYPTSALSEKSPIVGIQIFNNLCTNFTNLINKPFTGNFPKNELTGATYHIQFSGGKEPILFSIMALQANDSQPEAKWAMWFGSLGNIKIKERFSQILNFLKEKNITLDLNYN